MQPNLRWSVTLHCKKNPAQTAAQYSDRLMELTIRACPFFLDATVIIKQEPHIKVTANYEKSIGIFYWGKPF